MPNKINKKIQFVCCSVCHCPFAVLGALFLTQAQSSTIKCSLFALATLHTTLLAFT